MNRLVPTLVLLAAACPGAEVLPMWWSDPPAPPPELAAADDKGRPRPIRVLRMCLLESSRGKPGEPWALLRRTPPTEPGGEPGWAPYVQVRLPEKAERVAVLIVPSSPPGAMTVELAAAAHPWGSVRLVNLTGVRVQGWVGRRRLDLAPGAQASSEAATQRRTEELVLQSPETGGAPRLLLSSRAILDPGRRSVVFLARLPDGRLETRALEETLPEEAEAGESGR